MIEKEIRAALEAVPGCRIGLHARSLEGPQASQEAGFSEDEPLTSASLIKLVILAELLRRADAGLPLSRTTEVGEPDLVGGSEAVSKLDLPSRPTLRWLAEAMITTSDNTATNALIDYLGFPEINARARSLGLANTHLGRYMMDSEARARSEENLTSARDAAALLAGLYGGESLSAHSRRLALEFLLSQPAARIADELSAGLSPGVQAGGPRRRAKLRRARPPARPNLHPLRADKRRHRLRPPRRGCRYKPGVQVFLVFLRSAVAGSGLTEHHAPRSLTGILTLV